MNANTMPLLPGPSSIGTREEDSSLVFDFVTGFAFTSDFHPNLMKEWLRIAKERGYLKPPNDAKFLTKTMLHILTSLSSQGDKAFLIWCEQMGGGSIWDTYNIHCKMDSFVIALLTHGFMVGRRNYLALRSQRNEEDRAAPTALEKTLGEAIDDWTDKVDGIIWPGTNYSDDEVRLCHDAGILNSLIQHSAEKQSPPISQPGSPTLGYKIQMWLTWLSITEAKVTDTDSKIAIFLQPIFWKDTVEKYRIVYGGRAGEQRRQTLAREEGAHFACMSEFGDWASERLDPNKKWKKTMVMGLYTPWMTLHPDHLGPDVAQSTEEETEATSPMIEKHGLVIIARLLRADRLPNGPPYIQLAMFDPMAKYGTLGGREIPDYSNKWVLDYLFTEMSITMSPDLCIDSGGYWGGKGLDTAEMPALDKFLGMSTMFIATEFMYSVAEGGLVIESTYRELEDNHGFSYQRLGSFYI